MCAVFASLWALFSFCLDTVVVIVVVMFYFWWICPPSSRRRCGPCWVSIAHLCAGNFIDLPLFRCSSCILIHVHIRRINVCFLLCAVPVDAPSDVAVFTDYRRNAVRVIWALQVRYSLWCYSVLPLGCLLQCRCCSLICKKYISQ